MDQGETDAEPMKVPIVAVVLVGLFAALHVPVVLALPLLTAPATSSKTGKKK